MCRHHLYLELVSRHRLLPKSGTSAFFLCLAPARKRMDSSMTKMMASSTM
ncbi:hypothetical protein LINPERPRIM_LOCUS33043, partial [Linum perenne]